MNKYRWIGIRIAISTSVGTLVAAIACLVVWRNLGQMPNVRPEQALTKRLFEDMNWPIESYQAETKTVAQSWG